MRLTAAQFSFLALVATLFLVTPAINCGSDGDGGTAGTTGKGGTTGTGGRGGTTGSAGRGGTTGTAGAAGGTAGAAGGTAGAAGGTAGAAGGTAGASRHPGSASPEQVGCSCRLTTIPVDGTRFGAWLAFGIGWLFALRRRPLKRAPDV